MVVTLPPPVALDAHKGEAGRVLAIAGSRRMPGAAILVARAAQRAGAGLVTVGCVDSEVAMLVPGAAPEAVLAPIENPSILPRRSQNALLLGPGIGDDARARKLLKAFLECAPDVPRVLDADGLNALDGEPERLRDAAGRVVITPHPGEAERLLGEEVPRDGRGRRAAALALAERSGATVVLKGRGTLVVIGDEVFVGRTGNPGMATAGAGDVLAGVLLAYLGRRLDPFGAACAAVHVHGLAGDLAADVVGRRALIASDLVAYLGAAQRTLDEA